MSDVLKVLRGARKLLTPPGAWMQGRYANKEKTCFCVLGALGMVEKGKALDPSDLVIQALHKTRSFYGPVSAWNDRKNRTQADVLALLDKAIAKAEARS